MLHKAALLLALAACVSRAQTGGAPTTWYKFHKQFVDGVFPADSAIGDLTASSWSPAKSIHTVGCGGNDGELHVGVPGNGIVLQVQLNGPVSALATDNSYDFGVVAEPPNATPQIQNRIAKGAGQITFHGYYRVWNEGHDRGKAYPSNPHHVLELHPAWAFRLNGEQYGSPNAIYSMTGYHGYGASKYGPLLTSIAAKKWLRVGEDAEYIYVQLLKADNFYQLPVAVKESRPVTNGREFLVDVYSEGTHKKLVFPNLTVVVAAGTPVAAALAPGQKTFLLGFFSVDLRKAMTAAAGHAGPDASVFAPEALEFFAFGRPKGQSVPKASACPEPDEGDR